MVESKPSRSKQIFMQIVIAAVILVSGVIIGSGATILLAKNRIIWIRPSARPDAAAIAHKISEKYGLDDQQAAQLENIFKEGVETREAIHKEMDEKMEAERQVLVNKIKQVMTPQQFEKWYADFQERIEKHKNRHK